MYPIPNKSLSNIIVADSTIPLRFPSAARANPGLRIVSALFLSQLCALAVLAIFGPNLDPHNSILVTTMAGFFSICVFYAAGLRWYFNKSALKLLLIAYVLRLLVGVVHYLTIMDPNYFENPGFFSYLWDFKWMHESLSFVSNWWHLDGFFSPLPDWYFQATKNAYLNMYSGLLYYFSGVNALNIAPWNSLHNIYTAGLIGMLALQEGGTRKQALFAMTLAAFQPFGFISSLMWRDSVGQSFLVLGVYLLVTYRRRIILCTLLLPVAAFLTYTYREPYLMVILTGTIAMWLIQRQFSVAKKLSIMAAVVTVTLAGQLFSILWNIGIEQRSLSGEISSQKFIYLPLRALRAVMGPFPWWQIFDRPDGYEYMPADLAQAVFNVAVMVIIIPECWRQWKRRRSIDPPLLFGMLFWIGGIVATGVHMAYVSAGIVLLLPIACKGRISWPRAFLFSGSFFFVTNLVYWLTGIYRTGSIMGITGY